ncbi:MAG: GntR family transcriptional regulator [Bryobacterales bacterium]|nr:GntR family transcriptional regulator [Bryobacterales bacterium]
MNAAAPRFETIRKESTRDKVYRAIREAILAGKLPAGERISEIPLAGEFQVSRSIVREALLQLAHDGLVEQNSYKGTHVILLTPEQVDEILGARLLIEAEVVRQANRNLTPALKKELLQLARELESLTADPEQFAAKDLQLHHRIWDASGNQTLTRILHQLTAPLFAMGTILRYAHPARPGKPAGPAFGEHLRLVQQISNGNEEQAAEAIRRHIAGTWTATRERVREYISKSPHRPADPARLAGEFPKRKSTRKKARP